MDEQAADICSLVEVEQYDLGAHNQEKVTEAPKDIRIRHVKSKEEKRLVLKQDLLILPLLSGSIFFGYLVHTHSLDPKVLVALD